MTRLQTLYDHLTHHGIHADSSWLQSYKGFTGQVRKVRAALKRGLRLRDPKAYDGTEFEDKPNPFAAFAEELIFAPSNGIAACGQARMAKPDFNRLIADNTFVNALEDLIRAPSAESFKAFRERLLNLKIGNHWLRMNRVLAACTTAVSTTVYETNFDEVYSWLIREELVQEPMPPAVDWYEKNVHLVNQLRERLRNDDVPATTDEHRINIFVWQLFDYVKNIKGAQMIIINKLADLLASNHQIVLTGAPGTGKTFLARELAAHLLGCSSNELKNEETFGFVQFHPAYDYTDFVEGLKPEKDDKGEIGFKLRNGIFREFCEKAKNHDGKCLFVIDEINRADLSRVFGELFYALEPDYRGEKGQVLTQYATLRDGADKQFYVPKNVYIIGTMNDIDRSVESIDFALRRRFAWYEVEADGDRFDAVMHDVLTNKPDLKKKAKDRYKELNDSIAEPENGLGSAYKIGPAYYRKLGNYEDKDEQDMWNIFWERHLEPLIREYVRGMSNTTDRVEKFHNAYALKKDGTQQP